jgi:hypothetical protein
MFESLDDPTPPPAPVDTDATRVWQAGRRRVRQRVGACVSAFVVVAAGSFALVNRPVSNAVVTSPTNVVASPTSARPVATTTTVAFASDSGDQPSTRAPSGTPDAGTTPAPHTPGTTSSAPDATTPPAPGAGTPSPETPSPEMPPASSEPEPAPTPEPDLTWSATLSSASAEYAQAPVLDVYLTIRNNTAAEQLASFTRCDPHLERFYLGTDGVLYPEYAAGHRCFVEHHTVAAFSETTETLSVKLRITTGHIPVGTYRMQVPGPVEYPTLTITPRS